ncbi:hypothetical protein QYE76_039271 [Lolium multiflorum]|uniref:Integrase catalytic domain-containing protein n=1 Tax=Lolium multiflorum TaxID=4521 RepID=A0AAD8WUB5_LOLMU|nr:hypothetical protein QYE76_039271 [Lolium multiflorum]
MRTFMGTRVPLLPHRWCVARWRVQAEIERRAKAYTIINHQLYKRSVSGVFRRCIEPIEGIELLREIHQGECGHHVSSRAIVAKAFRHGFYWPTVLKDAAELVKKCDGCQRFAKKRHSPASTLKTIPITWPFAVWGLDMVGPFRTARGGMTHLLVMIDKFTKWIEAKPIKKLDGSTAVTFLKDIIVRYGYPHRIITDNGSNFSQGIFSRYCEEMGIRMDLASVAHQESNGQVEKANGLILAGIRPRLVEPLERAAGCWIEELPNHDAPRIKLYTKPKLKKLAKMESTWSKRPDCWPCPDLPFTSKASDAITAGRSSP